MTYGIDGEVVLDVHGASAQGRVRAAHRIADLVDAAVVAPEVRVVPSGGTASFAWPGGFGPVPRSALRDLLLTQMLDPVYLDDVPVFPILTADGWRFEVVHPSPRGSSPSMGLLFSGPPGGGRLVAAAARDGWRPVSRRRRVRVFEADGIRLEVEARPRRMTRPFARGPRWASAEWHARLRAEVAEVAGVGARVTCDDPVLGSSRAATVGELYGRLVVATASGACGTSWAELACPAGLPASVDHAVRHLSSEASRWAGYVVLLAPEGERRGELGPEPWSGTTVLGDWRAPVQGVDSRVRVLEHTHASRERWRSLAVHPLAAPAPTSGPGMRENYVA